MLIIIGVISALNNDDISYSLFACFLGLLFYLNIYNLVVYRNFNLLESKLIHKFFSILTLLIFFAIIFQIISVEIFSNLESCLG